MGSPGSAVRAKTAVEPTVPEVPWQSLVGLRGAGQSNQGRASAAPSRRLPWVGLSVAVAVLLFAVVVALGVVLRVWTSQGLIELVNLPHDAEVFVDGEEATVTWPSGGKPAVVTVTPGKHKVKIKRDGIEISGDEVTVHVGGKQEFIVRFVPLPDRHPVQDSPPADSAEATKAPLTQPPRTASAETSKSEKARDQAPRDSVPDDRDRRAAEVVLPPHPATLRKPSGPSARAKAVRPVTSRFDDGRREGWYTLNHDDTPQATSPIRVDTMLFPQGRNWWLLAEDLLNGKEFGWHAPRKYLGDHSDKFGRLLRYSLWTTGSGARDTDWSVRLCGRGKILFIDVATLGAPPPLEWKPYSIRLDASGGWKVFTGPGQVTGATNEDLKDVLSNVTDLRFKGEFGIGPNWGCLDNVEFGADPSGGAE